MGVGAAMNQRHHKRMPTSQLIALFRNIDDLLQAVCTFYYSMDSRRATCPLLAASAGAQ